MCVRGKKKPQQQKKTLKLSLPAQITSGYTHAYFLNFTYNFIFFFFFKNLYSKVFCMVLGFFFSCLVFSEVILGGVICLAERKLNELLY